MRKLWIYIVVTLATLVTWVGCDVHEFPDMPETAALCLRLNYDTDMTVWEHIYEDYEVKEQGYGITYDNHLDYGKIRYIVHAYPVVDRQRATVQEPTHKFVFTKDVARGYDHEEVIELPAGQYNIMVWSDMVKMSGDEYFYNATDFAEIFLQGDHRGSTDHRDAFRGSNQVVITTTVVDLAPDTLDITMQRPLAKYEIQTTDLKEFIDKEYEFLEKEAATRGETSTVRVNTDDYKVVFFYPGYMPNAYNMHIDKPVDSKLNVLFDSKLKILSDNEASLGFDYVFVNGNNAAVTVQVGLYDKEGRQKALSDPINLPLHRSYHSILRGSFLLRQATGGIEIDPEFDGDITIRID
ncbi:MAG: hypothetical protein IKM35_04605 [Bacteroidaceae bacterium]|nr:hypothetical protein [Bacteroidaceae bacterium]